MAEQDNSNTTYPPAYTFFQKASTQMVPYSGPKIISENQSTVDTVTTPVTSIFVISAASGKEYFIKEIISVTTNNIIDFNLPLGELLFVVGPDDTEVPSIGPMDEIYIFCADRPDNFTNSTNIPSPDAFTTENRIFTGLVHEMHEAWSTSQGQVYRIIFTTNMKKFDVTSEFRTLGYLKNQGNFSISAAGAALLSSKNRPPGEFVRAACDQSNVAFAYIFDPVGELYDIADAKSIPNSAPNQNAIYTKNAFVNPNDIPDGIATDAYQNITAFNQPLFKSLTNMLVQFNPTTHVFQTWVAILADIIAGTFLEFFFSRFGLLYSRNLGMFLPAGRWDWEIDPSVIIEYDDKEADASIVTRVQPQVENLGIAGGPLIPFVYGAPNMTQLETLYGPRYKVIQVPWAVFSIDAPNGNGPSSPNPQQTKASIQGFLGDYCQVYMALQNSSNITGTCTILGFANLELGQTIYFPHKNRVFYIIGISHVIISGQQWFTKLTLSYGRPKEADLLNYINQRAVNLGIPDFGSGSSDSNPSASSPLGNGAAGIPINGDTHLGTSPLGFQCQIWVQTVFNLPAWGATAIDAFNTVKNGGGPAGSSISTSPGLQGGLLVYFNPSADKNNDGGAGHVGFVNADGQTFTSVWSTGDVEAIAINTWASQNKTTVAGYVYIQQGDPASPNFNINNDPTRIGLTRQKIIDLISGVQEGITSSGIQNMIPTQGNPPYMTDPGYAKNVLTFSAILAQNLHASNPQVIKFFAAKADTEVDGQGTLFSGRWNYLNLQPGFNTTGTLVVNQFNHTNIDYGNLELAAKDAALFLNQPSYKPFLAYIQGSSGGSFSPEVASNYLNIQGGFTPLKDNPDDTNQVVDAFNKR